MAYSTPFSIRSANLSPSKLEVALPRETREPEGVQGECVLIWNAFKDKTKVAFIITHS